MCHILKIAQIEHHIHNISIQKDGRNFFDQLINNDIKTYENIRKISTGQGDHYATG